MTVPSFIYRWQASPDEVVPTRNGWEIDLPANAAHLAAVFNVRTGERFHVEVTAPPPTLRLAQFAWALGAAPLAFNFPPFVSAWQPWKRPWDWERDGC